MNDEEFVDDDAFAEEVRKTMLFCGGLLAEMENRGFIKGNGDKLSPKGLAEFDQLLTALVMLGLAQLFPCPMGIDFPVQGWGKNISQNTEISFISPGGRSPSPVPMGFNGRRFLLTGWRKIVGCPCFILPILH